MPKAKDEAKGEEWRAVAICPRYEVSSLGRLRRKLARGGHRMQRPGPDARGYIYATLSLGEGRGIRRCTLHSLIAEAFIGPRPHGYTVNHKDGVKANNLPANLEWVTIGENLRHALRLGLRIVHGERSGASKLTDARALLLYQLLGLREWSQLELSRAFGIAQSHVSRINLGHSRMHSGIY